MNARIHVFLGLALATGVCGLAQSAPRKSDLAAPASPASGHMKIAIKINQTELFATLEDNATAKSFTELLPLDLELEDYNRTEKVADLPKKLDTTGAPEGVEPSAGDIAYYAPWGNLAIFYHDFRYSTGLIKLGKLDSGIDKLRRAGAIKVRIELVQQR